MKANVSVVNSIVDQVLKVFTLQETSSSNMPSSQCNMSQAEVFSSKEGADLSLIMH